MANAKMFRRFLENSMKQSDRPLTYYDRLINSVFTKEVTVKLENKLKRCIGKLWTREFDQKGISIVMGYTRRRENFRSHFADDQGFWGGTK